VSVRPAAVAHGGVGTPAEESSGCRAAVDVALTALAAGASVADAAVEGAKVLEDDPRYNAGTGSVVRLDGSVQMDASVMDSTGAFGAVAAIERVKNPVAVARAVMETPHLLLAGDGATWFARRLGHGEHDPVTAERRRGVELLKARLRAQGAELPDFWRDPGQWRRLWNYQQPPEALGLGASDTIGVVVRGAEGAFAAALSTGGTSLMLRGRVGDVPVFGAGLYAAPDAAVAATGLGERIVERLLARTLAGWLTAGVTAQQASERAVRLVGDGAPIGVVVVTATEIAGAADRPMAWAGREDGGPWHGPEPRA
jgi:beta-aspartyl-peptidase (threonine type)